MRIMSSPFAPQEGKAAPKRRVRERFNAGKRERRICFIPIQSAHGDPMTLAIQVKAAAEFGQ